MASPPPNGPKGGSGSAVIGIFPSLMAAQDLVAAVRSTAVQDEVAESFQVSSPTYGLKGVEERQLIKGSF